MSPEDIRKLLGGYATGTLTLEEQQALFNAALEDQALFDALAREQSLRDLLQDPGARAQLLAAMDERPQRWYSRWWRPAALALATASVAILAVVAIRQNTRPSRTSVTTIAEVKPPAAAASAPEAKQEADQAKSAAKPAPLTAPSANAVRAKQQFEPPEQVSKETTAQPGVPELPPPAPTVRESRPAGIAGGSPGGVMGGIVGGAPPAAPPAPSGPKTETPAKDQLMAADFAATTGNQRARMLFFGTPQVSGFLDTRNAPAPSARPEAAQGGSRDERKQQQTAEQARTMMRSTSSALATRVTQPGDTPLGIRYTLLRKTTEGAFVETVSAGLQSGDTVEIRFEANQDGFLSVLGNGARPIAAINLSRRMPYTTVPIEPGTEHLTVRFSRVPITGAAGPSDNFLETPGNAGDRATYVVSSNPLGDPLVFTISLRP